MVYRIFAATGVALEIWAREPLDDSSMKLYAGFGEECSSGNWFWSCRIFTCFNGDKWGRRRRILLSFASLDSEIVRKGGRVVDNGKSILSIASSPLFIAIWFLNSFLELRRDHALLQSRSLWFSSRNVDLPNSLDHKWTKALYQFELNTFESPNFPLSFNSAELQFITELCISPLIPVLRGNFML